MNHQHIMNLAMKRRATLIKRLDKLRESGKHDHATQVKCDQIMMRLQGENEIISDCNRMLERARNVEFLFLSMVAAYEYLGFDALWKDFENQYPGTRFPKEYARTRFEDMMNEGLEAAE
jgi:hypothetical protein